MRAHLAARSPEEGCGVLLGQRAYVEEALPLPNSSPTPRVAYQLSASALLEAEREASRRGLEVLGYFHSHPTSAAQPSARDRLEAVPGAVYVILADTEITAWLATASGLQPLPLA